MGPAFFLTSADYTLYSGMRHCTHDSGLIRNENGDVIGINMGWDFVSEHEWGTEKIRQLLGIQNTGNGPDRYLATNFSNFYFEEREINGVTWYIVAVSSNYQGLEKTDYGQYLPQWFNEDQEVVAAWSGNSGFVFGVRDREVFEQVKAQIEAGNIIVTGESIFAAESNPFSNAGLKVLFYMDIPEQWTNDWTEAHLGWARLDAAVKASGIKDRLKAADRRYFALSPRWSNDEETEFKFWLNPMKQDQYNSCWCTIEDLDAWINDEGPIPKNATQAS